MSPRTLCALSLCAAFLANPAMAAERLRVLLDWYVNPDHGPVIVAEKLGLFEKAGLEVEIIPPADPADPPKLVAAGAADIAVSYQPQLHLQAHEGLPLRRIGALIDSPLTCLAARADGPVAGIADLRGRKIGYSVAGIEEALLTALLAPVGLTLDDVTLINVNFALTPALMSGQVDAAMGAFRNFELTQMRLEGVEGRCFNLEEHGAPFYDELIYVANPERVDMDAAARFLSAVGEAARFIAEAPEQGWELLKAFSPELDDALNRQAWRDTYPRFARDPLAFDAARYDAFERFLREHGLIDEIWPADRFAASVGR